MAQIRAALVIQHCGLGRFEDNLASCLELTANAANKGADLVVFPEMNLTGYGTGEAAGNIARPLDKGWTGKLSAAADDFDVVILAGLAETDSKGKIRATQLVFRPGQDLAAYHKIHLAPQEMDGYARGNQVQLFNAKGLCFGIQLCYDAHFPELSLAMALKGADAIFMPHASPRGTPREKYDSWLRHLTARAFDNGLYIAAVNQCGENGGGLSFPGVAVVIGPDGLPKSSALSETPTIHLGELDLDAIHEVRNHRMRYFLPNRRTDLFPLS